MTRIFSPEERARLVERAERRFGLARAYPEEIVQPDKDDMMVTSANRDRNPASPQQMADAIDRCWTLSRALTVRSESLMSLPIQFFNSGDPVEEGPLVELFTKPNPWWSFPELMAMTERTLNTSPQGAFWVLDGFVNGKPTEMWWVDPESISIVKGKKSDKPEDWYIKGFELDLGFGKKKKELDKDRVVWFHIPTPDDEFANAPLVESAIKPALLAIRSMDANLALHDNALTGAAIIHPEGDDVWTPKQVKDIAGVLNNTIKGQNGWHRIALMNKGGFSIKDVASLSPRDAQFREMLMLTDRQICIATGVPKPLLEPTDATFSNTDGARAILWSTTLIPRTFYYAGAIKRQIVDRHYAEQATQVEFDYGAIPELQENIAERWEVEHSKMDALTGLIKDVSSGEITMAAAAALATHYIGVPEDDIELYFDDAPGSFNTDPQLITAVLGGGAQAHAGAVPRDTVIGTFVHLLGVEVTVAEEMLGSAGIDIEPSAPAALPAPEIVVEEPEPDPEPEEEDEVEEEPEAEPEQRAARRPEPRRRALPDLWAEEAGDLRSTVESLFDGQAGDVRRGVGKLTASRLTSIFEDNVEDPEHITSDEYERLATAYAEATLGRGFVGTWTGKGVESLERPATSAARRALRWQYGDLGGEGQPEEGDPFANLVMGEVAQYAQVTAESSAREVGMSLARSARDGLSIEDAQEAAIGKASRWGGERAIGAAATLALGLVMGAATLGASLAGAVTKTWNTVGDDRVRDTHQGAEGQTVSILQDFSVGGATGPAPGRMSTLAENINCRCWLTFGFGGG